MYVIQAAVGYANFDMISSAKSSKDAYDILVKCYEGGEKVKNVKLQALRRQYEVLEMDNNESVAAYVSKV
ncbi:F-box protein [Trifolium pratense]|uniref:F-box protein n=1 Tax=Trifolium pratense TaxID=57577 RepID=A0A2K3KCG3_TRIPR|nr:F-box protein [Trifolium pratense]